MTLQIDSQGSAALLLFLSVATQHSIDRKRIGRLHSSLQIEFTHSAATFPSNALQEVSTEWSPPLLGGLALCPPPPRLRHRHLDTHMVYEQTRLHLVFYQD